MGGDRVSRLDCRYDCVRGRGGYSGISERISERISGQEVISENDDPEFEEEIRHGSDDEEFTVAMGIFYICWSVALMSVYFVAVFVGA